MRINYRNFVFEILRPFTGHESYSGNRKMKSTICHVSRVAMYLITQISNESENGSWPYLLMY